MAGFGSYGGDLFVSVSGSQFGGGTLGSVNVVYSSGAVIADLEQGTVGMPFDPRGLYFASDDQLLIADTEPSILSATPAAFSLVTPEPSSMLPLGVLLVSVLTFKARRKRSLALPPTVLRHLDRVTCTVTR